MMRTQSDTWQWNVSFDFKRLTFEPFQVALKWLVSAVSVATITVSFLPRHCYQPCKQGSNDFNLIIIDKIINLQLIVNLMIVDLLVWGSKVTSVIMPLLMSQKSVLLSGARHKVRSLLTPNLQTAFELHRAAPEPSR